MNEFQPMRKNSPALCRVLAAMYLLLGGMFALFAVLLIRDVLRTHVFDALEVYCATVLLLMCLLFLYFSFFHAGIELRDYRADANGVTVRYFKKVESFYPWSHLRHACVADLQYKNAVTELVIRLSFMDEKHGPNNPKLYFPFDTETWRQPLFYPPRILLIHYTEKRMAEIRALCGRAVEDCLDMKRCFNIYQIGCMGKICAAGDADCVRLLLSSGAAAHFGHFPPYFSSIGAVYSTKRGRAARFETVPLLLSHGASARETYYKNKKINAVFLEARYATDETFLQSSELIRRMDPEYARVMNDAGETLLKGLEKDPKSSGLLREWVKNG